MKAQKKVLDLFVACVALALAGVGGAACSAPYGDQASADAKDLKEATLPNEIAAETSKAGDEIGGASNSSVAKNTIVIVNGKLAVNPKNDVTAKLLGDVVLGDETKSETDETTTPKPSKDLDDVGTDWWQW